MTDPFPSNHNLHQDSQGGTCLEGPPEESFDEKYNKRLEFPISLVSSVFIHVFIGTLLVVLLVYVMGGGSDQSSMKVSLVSLQGLDNFGDGAVGKGGKDNPEINGDWSPVTDETTNLDPTKLPEIKEDIRKTIKYLDPTGNLPLSPSNLLEYQKLEKSIRDKLLGARQGAGPGPGSGNDNTPGTGPGGKGADSTLARNMRWVLRFKVESGRNYLEQLKAMGAEILIEIPDTKKCTLIADLSKQDDRKEATDDDLKRLAGKVKFSDSRPQAVKAVLGTLGLEKVDAKSFWAFFPKELENDLAKKELSYRNRRSEDIEETIFSVVVKDGKYEIKVEEQKIKK